MKKIIIFVLALSILTLAFVGCNKTPEQFTGEWKFSKITDIEFSPDVTAEDLALLMEHYGVEDEAGLLDAVLAKLDAENTFDPCYINFEKENTYTYDPIMDREATWVYYQTAENEGFLSFYTEIDPSEVTPDPVVFPPVVYNAEKGTITMPIQYAAYIVTVEFVR